MQAEIRPFPRPPQEARRRQLIDATLSAIAEHGLSRTTLAKVARLARLSAGIVNFYFRSKDELLLATLRGLVDEFEAGVGEALAGAGDDPVAALEALVEINFDPALADPRKVAVWYAFWSEAGARADYLKLCGDKDRRYLDTVRDRCAALVARGPYSHVDAEGVAHAFVGLIDSLWQGLLVEPGDEALAAARRIVRAFLASVFPHHFSAPESATGPARAVRPLPGWSYRDADLHARERAALFAASWQPVCHLSEVARPRDFVTFPLESGPGMVVRGDDGELRALANVCLHRGHRLLEAEAGRCQARLRCPYHRWTYGLDGVLRSGPDATGAGDGPPALPAFEVEVALGFVFVRAAKGGSPLAARLGPCREALARVRREQLVPAGAPATLDLDADWKLVMEHYMSDYAATPVAPLLAPADVREADAERGAGRLEHPLLAPRDAPWTARAYGALLEPGARRRLIALFPNVVFDIRPERTLILRALPLGPGRTRLVVRRYSPPPMERRMRALAYLGRRLDRALETEAARHLPLAQEGLAARPPAARDVSHPRPAAEAVVAALEAFIRARVPLASSPTERPAQAGRRSP